MLDVRQLQDSVEEELVKECCGGSGFIMKPASRLPDMRHLVAAAAAIISAQRESAKLRISGSSAIKATTGLS